MIHKIPSWLTVPSQASVFHQVDNLHDFCIPYDFEVKELKKKRKNIIKQVLLSKLAVKDEKCLAESHVISTECVTLFFSSNRICLNCYTKFMTLGFFLVYLVIPVSEWL